jgi:hypothetical protein
VVARVCCQWLGLSVSSLSRALSCYTHWFELLPVACRTVWCSGVSMRSAAASCCGLWHRGLGLPTTPLLHFCPALCLHSGWHTCAARRDAYVGYPSGQVLSSCSCGTSAAVCASAFVHPLGRVCAVCCGSAGPVPAARGVAAVASFLAEPCTAALIAASAVAGWVVRRTAARRGTASLVLLCSHCERHCRCFAPHSTCSALVQLQPLQAAADYESVWWACAHSGVLLGMLLADADFR